MQPKMKPQPFKDFGESLKGYFDNKDLSDAVIRCEDKEFAVHKLVLFNHSEHFAKQLDDVSCKEDSDNAITIEDFGVDVVKAMVQFMYHFDYKTPEDSSSLILNTKVYQIADQYGIQSLKEHAAGKFARGTLTYVRSDEFPIAVNLVCTTTPSTDMGLRNSILITTFDNFDATMCRDEFREALKMNPDFAADLYRYLFEKTRGISQLDCPKCKQHFQFECMDAVIKYCPLCANFERYWIDVEASARLAAADM